MAQFLTKDVEKKLNRITLEYIYSKEINFGDRIKRQMASTSDIGHYEILEHMQNRGLIPYDQLLELYIQDMDIYGAGKRIAEMGDVLIHIPRKEEEIYSSVWYCPENLGDYQQLRLRLWYEYYAKNNHFFEVSHQTGSGVVSYDKNQVESYLEEQGILDDQLIRQLVRKYPNFE